MYEKLVENIMNRALARKVRGKRIMVYSFGFDGAPVVRELCAAIAKAGGSPDAVYEDAAAKKAFLDNATPEAIEARVAVMEKHFAEYDHFIRILAERDLYELADANRKNMALFNRLYGTRVRDGIMLKRGYTLFNVPTIAFSTKAGMSFEAYGALWDKVTGLDYTRMRHAMRPL
ncbi:MAG: aminopeptidase, partial [Rickettsiales bacterium]|nr:aminopeptidase [Rickettsiales bacterium]